PPSPTSPLFPYTTLFRSLLAPQFERYPAVYRSAETGPAYLPLMFAGLFIAALVAAIIYAKGYDGGSGVAEGGRFGFLLGIFVVRSEEHTSELQSRFDLVC